MRLASAVVTLAVAAVGMLTFSACAAGSPEPLVSEVANDVPPGFESDDLYLPDVWVSNPTHGGTACGTGPLADCWNLTIMSESGCDPYALLTINERDKSGAALESYQRAVGAGEPGEVNEFSWDSQHFNEHIIDSVEVERAGCTDAM